MQTRTPLDRVGDRGLEPRVAGRPRSRPAVGIYFPILHLVMPVFIGAALILRRGRESAQEADLADIQVG